MIELRYYCDERGTVIQKAASQTLDYAIETAEWCVEDGTLDFVEVLVDGFVVYIAKGA